MVAKNLQLSALSCHGQIRYYAYKGIELNAYGGGVLDGLTSARPSTEPVAKLPLLEVGSSFAVEVKSIQSEQ